MTAVQGSPPSVPQPLAGVRSVKVKLGLLVAVSVVVASVLASLGQAGGVPLWLSIPVTVLLALAVTQLLAVGMTSPLRQMTDAARQMATGDYAVRVDETSRDEVGDLARAFNTMAHDLGAVDRQRRELVANVSHELRTPLAALCAQLENVVDGVVPGDPPTLSAALHQAERLAHLVEDLLDLARVDAGKAPLTPVDVEVGALLDESVAEVRALGRVIEYDVRTEPHLTVRADPLRLRQLVTNLLDNASRHSPAGGTVTVTASRDGGRFRLEVADRGPGVPPADRDHVFEAFGTLTGPEGGGGTGLGLAIARWVTDLHGGVIGFADPEPPDHGARVRVDLPAEPPSRAVAQEGPMTAAAPQPTPPALPVAVPPRPLLDDLFGGFWPEHGTPAKGAVLVGAVACGVLAAIVLPFRDAGLGTVLVLVACGGLVVAVSRNRRDPFTLGSAVLCGLLALAAMIRAADWIVALCFLAGAGLCIIAVTQARTMSGFVLSGVSWPLSALRGLPWLGRTLTRLTGLGQGAAVLRTAVWSLLGLVVFGALFASADALVGEWVDAVLPDLTLDTFVLRVFLTVAVGGTVLGAAYVGLNPPRVDGAGGAARPVTHRYEWLAPVLVVIAVFVTFLAAQARVVFGGHDYLRRTTGLTYAEYVHQGFGQLTVATILTLLVLWAAARKAPRNTAADRGWLRGSLGLLCVMTLVVIGSALHRMQLYQEAYGFTRLRLLVDVFDLWLALVFLAIMAGGAVLRGGWLPRFALLSGVIALLGLAAINPDAWIAQRNIDRLADTGKVDWYYLQHLSDDAVPTFTQLPAGLQHCALDGYTGSDDDWLEWNLGRARAADVLGNQPTARWQCASSD